MIRVLPEEPFFFNHLLNKSTFDLRRLWGLFGGLGGSFHSSEYVGRGAESLVPDVSVAFRHANRRRRRPSHDARHDRIGDAGFQQAGHCSVP